MNRTMWMIGAFLAGCAPEPAGGDDVPENPLQGEEPAPATWTDYFGTPIELTMGSNSWSFVGYVQDWEVTAGADCDAAVYLVPTRVSGIFVEPAFLDRSPGTGTIMQADNPSPGAMMQWSATDPYAAADADTDEWAGTWSVAEWTDDRVVIDLVDGVHCDLPDRANCVEEEGQLVYEGARQEAIPAIPGTNASGYADLTSGAPLCGYQ